MKDYPEEVYNLTPKTKIGDHVNVLLTISPIFVLGELIKHKSYEVLGK